MNTQNPSFRKMACPAKQDVSHLSGIPLLALATLKDSGIPARTLPHRVTAMGYATGNARGSGARPE
jgi:hypothetical protein